MAAPTARVVRLNLSLFTRQSSDRANRLHGIPPSVIQKFFRGFIPGAISWIVCVGLLFFSVNASAVTAAVGATAGAFAVSPGGSATYTIPIAVAPGTNGMQPSLSLVYNSQSGNGLLGVGWSISGMSIIHRCAATIDLDGYNGGINYDANDRFCLDGERLVVVNGAYGALYSQYRTQHESLRKVLALGQIGGGPTSFVVYTKDGSILNYGAVAFAKTTVNGKSPVRVWALYSIRDVNGNFLTHSSQFDITYSQYYPSLISYTGNSSTGTLLYNSVQLNYGEPPYTNPRPDIEMIYTRGSSVWMTRRLTSVVSYAADGSVVRKYVMTYDNNGAGGRSRLTSIQECGTDNVCLPPTRFDWSNSSVGFSETFRGPAWSDASGWGTTYSSISLSGGGVSTKVGVMAKVTASTPIENIALAQTPPLVSKDFNGDGRAVLCARDANGIVCHPGTGSGFGPSYRGPDWSNANNWQLDQYNSTIQYPDLNGDGMLDLCARDPNGMVCLYGTGSGFVGSFRGPDWSDANGWSNAQYYSTIRFPDLDGDGRADLCARDPNGIVCYLNTGAGYTFGFRGPNWSDATGWSNPQYYTTIQFPDLNADGKADLCARDLNGVVCYLGTGSGFTSSFRGPTWSDASGWIDPKYYSTIQYPDLNGDGQSDICARDKDGIVCGLGTGASFVIIFRGPSWSDTAGWGDPKYYSTIRFADINGDGKPEICARDANGITCHHGVTCCGVRFGANFRGPDWSDAAGWGTAPYYSTIRFADLNGDGKADLCARDANGIVCYNTIYGRGDFINTITDGLGAQQKITYKPLTDTSVYRPGSNASYPYQDVQTPTYVVSQNDQSNGISGLLNTTTYSYRGLKRHLTADKFLGFGGVTVTDPAGLITANVYLQTLDGTEGMLQQSYTYAWQNGPVLKNIFNTWTPRNLGSGRTMAQLSTKSEVTRDLNNTLTSSLVTTYGYDWLDFPSQVVTEIGDGNTVTYKTTQNTTYQHDTYKWILGLPTRTEVTAEVPGQTPQTRVSALSYDSLGRLITEVIEPDRPEFTLTTAYDYDAFGNRTSATVSGVDIVTRTESQQYDARGQFIANKTNALGHIVRFENTHPTGALTKFTDANDLDTFYRYDGFGRKIGETRPDNTTTTINYFPWTSGGWYMQTIMDGAGQNRVYNDILSRPIYVLAQGLGGKWSYKLTNYDNLGRVIRISRPFFYTETSYCTTYSYDILGRVRTVTEPGPGTTDCDNTVGGRVTTTDYNGLTTTVTSPPTTASPSGQTRTLVKNPQGQLASTTDAAGTTAYQYDSFGNLKQVTDIAGNLTKMFYDLRGRKTSMADPDMGTWTYKYNVLSELREQKDAKLQTITMTYDLLGRMKTRVLPNGEGTGTWTYDTATKGIGKLESVSNPHATETYAYDSLSRPSSVTTSIGGLSYTTTTGYDAFSRIDTLTYPSGFKLKHRYDVAGNLFELRQDSDTGPRYWTANSADARGRLTNETYGNDLITQHQFDPATADLTNIQAGPAGNPTAVQNVSPSFDALDNLTARTWWDGTALRTETFGYDGLNRLTSVTGPAPKTYGYDLNGNLKNKSDVGQYTYPTNSIRPHAVTSTVLGTTTTNYDYDANGNMTTHAGRIIAYSSFNKPTSIAGPSGTTTLTYDANHRRFMKTASAETTVYLGRYEKIESGGVTGHKHHLYAGNHQVATLYRVAIPGYCCYETMQYLHTDHLGSVDTITDGTGIVSQRLSYDVFGKRRKPNGTDATTIIAQNTRGYTRHEHDDEVSLINMKAREYDPLLGRFITPDTIIPGATYSQSYNRYSYVNNNPLSGTDPTGHWSWNPFKSVTNAISSVVQSVTSVVHSAGETVQRNLHQAGEAIGRASTDAVSSIASVPYVGGLMATGMLSSPMFGFQYGATTSDWNSVGRATATAGVLATGVWAAPSIAAMPWYSSISTSTGLGYASGYSLARINGASNNQASAAGRDLAKFAFVTSSASILYNETVGYGATWESGGEAVTRGHLDPPVKGANVIGTVQEHVIDPSSVFGEGGLVSRALNVIPSGNALAGSHDAIMAAIESWGGRPAFYAFNLPAIPAAALVTAPALFSGPLGMAAYGCGHGGYCDSYQP